MKFARTFGSLLPAFYAFSALAAEEAEGPPQMDPTWYPNQLLWLAISFALLFIVVSRFVVPVVSRVLDEREHAIKEAIADAEHAKYEAETARGSAMGENRSARMKAAEIMANAQAENSKDAAAAFDKLDRELERKAGNAAAILEDAVSKAQSGIEEAAQSLGVAMTKALLGTAQTPEASAPKLKLAVKN